MEGNISVYRALHRRKRASGQTYQGIHKQSATATLAPSLIPANDTIDVIFPTYWVYPPKLDILHQEDMKCVERELRKLQDKNDPKKDIPILPEVLPHPDNGRSQYCLKCSVATITDMESACRT